MGEAQRQRDVGEGTAMSPCIIVILLLLHHGGGIRVIHSPVLGLLPNFFWVHIYSLPLHG